MSEGNIWKAALSSPMVVVPRAAKMALMGLDFELPGLCLLAWAFNTYTIPCPISAREKPCL